MNNNDKKQFVYTLTLEYIKQNNLLKCEPNQIPEVIEKCANISKIITESLNKNSSDFSLF